jgi:hypothetical protein
MDYQVSARKYRPGTFDDVIGQPHVVQTLVNAMTTKRIAQAYLFDGGAHSRQGAELRAGSHWHALRDLRQLHGNRARSFSGCD